MRQRPLQIRLPAQVRLGDAVTVDVLVDDEAAGGLFGAVVRLDCIMTGPAGTRGLWRADIDLPTQTGAPGTRVSVKLPRDLPPSYSGVLAKVDYRASLHGEWVDSAGRKRVADEVKQLRVIAAAPLRPDRASLRKTFQIAGSRRLDIELDGRRPARGQTIAGRLAVSGIAPSRVREVSIALVASEVVLAAGSESVVASRELARVRAEPVAVAEQDEWQAFGLPVPEDFPFTIRSPELRVESHLRFDVDLAWAFDGHADLPVTIDADALVAAELASESEQPGSWTRLAAGTRFAESGGELVADFGPVRARVTVAQRSRKPALLAAQLRYPSLRLGMRLEKDKFGRPDLQVVRARDRDQALVFSGALGPAAANLDAVTVDDERAHAAVEVVQPLRQLVKPFLAGVAQLAALLEGGRRIVPPPSSMAHCIGRWQSLARSMDGKLDVGAMAVAGQYQGMPASVSTGWGPSGAPVSTEIRLRLSWSLGASRHVSTSDDLAALPPGAMALAADCLRGRHHLEIDDSELVLVSPPLTEQLSEIDVVLDKMLRLAHELRAGAVYR